MANITYLPVQGKIQVGIDKVIAFNTMNKQSIQNAYTNDPMILSSASAVSNKDLLSQSFNIPSIEAVQPIQVQAEPISNVETNGGGVSFVGIPNVQNNEKLEDNPVNMSMEIQQPQITPIDNPVNLNAEPIPSIETPNPINNLNDLPLDPLGGLNITPLPETNINVLQAEINNETATPEIAPIPNMGNEVFQIPEPTQNVENNTMPTNDFQVSSGPNIFDQPISVENTMPNIIEENKTEESFNILQNIPVIGEEIKSPEIIAETNKEQNNSKNTIDNIDKDRITLEIELEKENAELFEKLANNCRRKAELLENKINEQKEGTAETENSASGLFNSNGTLNDNIVLDQLPNIENIA